MKIAICEDDIKTQSLLESYLEEYPADLEWKIFSSGEELLAHIKEDKDYFSLYFMDISLPGIDGIQTCAQIRKRDQKALIVFVTDYKEYVYEVFQVLPFRFLIKPVKKEAFSKVLREAADFLRLHDRRLLSRLRPMGGRRQRQSPPKGPFKLRLRRKRVYRSSAPGRLFYLGDAGLGLLHVGAADEKGIDGTGKLGRNPGLPAAFQASPNGPGKIHALC